MHHAELTFLLSCPSCHFGFHPDAASLTLDYCPRCLARRNLAIPLVAIGDAAADAAPARRWPPTGRDGDDGGRWADAPA
jgi:hypothetical protein